MPAQDAIWTADMVRALPDDGLRHEVLDGVHVVSPSPSRAHQRAVRVLLSMLEPYCAHHGLGEALDSPADIEFSDRDLLQPDVFVVPNTGPSWREATSLLLAVEVLSPSTARTDRHDKRFAYLRYRVPEYWIVDLDARLFERWRPDDQRPEVIHDSLMWQPQDGLPPLEIQLAEFFDAVVR